MASNATTIRIGHFQGECDDGNFEANLATVLAGLERAADAGLALVSFPESFLTGYFSDGATARANSFTLDGSEMKKVLAATKQFPGMYMVGFNELRGEDLYNTVAVIEAGAVVGTYSKAFPCYDYFMPGREFPVFRKDGLTFGIVICADGGYIEPCRILALKGAQLIFAPHFNRIHDPIDHFQMVRNDHIARAVENGVYFIRANNVICQRVALPGEDQPFMHGYGDSYILDPNGDKVASAGLYCEGLMIYELDLTRHHRVEPERNRLSCEALLEVLRETLAD